MVATSFRILCILWTHSHIYFPEMERSCWQIILWTFSKMCRFSSHVDWLAAFSFTRLCPTGTFFPQLFRRQRFRTRWLRVAEWVTVVIKEPAESELIKGMFWVFVVGRHECVQGHCAVPAVVPGAFFIHWIKVWSVHRVTDFWDIRCWLSSNVIREVHGIKEGVSLYFISSIPPQSVLCCTTKLGN